MHQAFVIDPADNVATVLQEVPAGATVTLLGETSVASCVAAEPVGSGHKIAIRPLAKGDSVIKFGMPIGHAARDVGEGAWVHLHNCSSHYDERSGTLDRESGAPTDIEYV